MGVNLSCVADCMYVVVFPVLVPVVLFSVC